VEKKPGSDKVSDSTEHDVQASSSTSILSPLHKNECQTSKMIAAASTEGAKDTNLQETTDVSKTSENGILKVSIALRFVLLEILERPTAQRQGSSRYNESRRHEEA
jgi:hypothetical protein